MDMANQDFRIDTYQAADAADWDAYVHDHQEGSFFHLAGWHQVLQEGLGHTPHYLLARRDQQIIGVFPLAEVKSWLFGHHLSALPFCVYGGPLADSEAVRQSLLRAAIQHAEQLQVDDLEIRCRQPILHHALTRDLYYGFRRHFTGDHDTDLKAIPRKQRAMVRKGINAGLSYTIDENWQDFLLCYDTSVRNLGTPAFPRRYFSALKKTFADRIDVLTVRDQGRPVASVLSFYFRDEVLPYYGGGTSAARHLAANDYMYWQLMNHAARRGARLFDFGRSKAGTGAFAFKKNWGFEPTPLPYQYHLVRASAMPEINPNNPKYALMIALWKKLPLSVSRVLGPFISRYVG